MVEWSETERFSRGDEFCVERDGSIISCGTVTMVRSKFGLLQLNQPEPPVQVGDIVRESSFAMVGISALYDRASVLVGTQIGLTWANVSTDPAPVNPFSSRSAINLGATVETPFTNTLGLKSAIIYTLKGAQSEANGTTLAFRLHYIEFPILFIAQLPVGNIIPFFQIGPWIAFLINAHQDTTANGETSRLAVRSGFNTVDAGGSFGLGVKASLIRSAVFLVDLRYGLGLTNALKQPAIWKNSSLQLTLGVMYPL